MTHLTDAEFVDLVDGVLATPRAAHVERCEACRTQAEAMRAALSLAGTNDVPEPSPLFWSHLAENVRQTIATEAIAPSGWFDWVQTWRAWPAAAALVTLVIVLAIWRDLPAPGNRPIVSERQAAVTAPTALAAANATDADADDDIDADEAWALVRTVADDVPWDQTHDAGISARPGSAERVAMQLTPAERKELARLLEDELKRSGA